MSIGRQMAKSAFWTMSMRFASKGIGFVSTLILARLLVPEDFGLVAIATATLALLELLAAFNFEVVLIQKKELRDVHLNTAWTLKWAIGLLQGIALAALASPLASFYGDQRLFPIFLALAVVLPLEGLKNIGIVYFQRDMQFQWEFILILIQRLVGFTVTVTLALLYESYWALVSGIIATKITGLVLSYILHKYRPKPCLTGWRELYSFTKWLYLNSFLFFVGHRAPDFVLGKVTGAEAVGLFSISYEIGTLPTTEMAAPINRAVFPGYAKMAHDSAMLREGYLRVLSLIALLILPAGVGISATADVLVPLLLGDKWLGAIWPIQILSLAGAMGVLLTNAGSVYLALGRPQILTATAIGRLLVFFPLLIVLVKQDGVAGAVLAYLMTQLIMVPVIIFIIVRIIDISPKELLAHVFRPILSVVIMYFSIRIFIAPLLQAWLGDILLARALLEVVAGGGLYFSVVLFLWKIAGSPQGPEDTIFLFTKKYIKQRYLSKKLAGSKASGDSQ